MVVHENGLIRRNNLSREQQARALEVEAVRRKTLADLIAGSPNATPKEIAGFKKQADDAAALAGQKIDRKADSDRLGTAVGLNSEYKRTLELLQAQAGAYGRLGAGSPQLELELKRLELRNGLMGQFALKMPKGTYASMSQVNRHDFDTQLTQGMTLARQQQQTDALKAYGESLTGLRRDMAGLGDDTGLAAGEFDRLNGIFSTLDPAKQFELKVAELRATIDKLRFGASDEIRSRQQSFVDGMTPTARGKVENQIRYRDERESDRLAIGGKPHPPEFLAAQKAVDDQRRNAADEEDTRSRIVDHLNRQKEMELSLVKTSAEKLAVEQRYQVLLRQRLGITQTPEEAKNEKATNTEAMADAKAADALAKVKSRADEMNQAIYGGLKDASERGLGDGFRSFSRSIFGTLKEGFLHHVSDSITNHVFGLNKPRFGTEGVPTTQPKLFTPPFAAPQGPYIKEPWMPPFNPTIGHPSRSPLGAVGDALGLPQSGGNAGGAMRAGTVVIHTDKTEVNGRVVTMGGSGGGSGTSPMTILDEVQMFS